MNKQNELQSVLSNKKKVLIIGPNGAGKSTCCKTWKML